MTGDASFMTREERSYGRMQAKRYKAAMMKHGLCAMCIHRAPDTITLFGLRVCKHGENRISEHCRVDGKQPKFEVDATAVERFRDGK